MPFKQMENVSNFLKSCRTLGVAEHSLFEVRSVATSESIAGAPCYGSPLAYVCCAFLEKGRFSSESVPFFVVPSISRSFATRLVPQVVRSKSWSVWGKERGVHSPCAVRPPPVCVDLCPPACDTSSKLDRGFVRGQGHRPRGAMHLQPGKRCAALVPRVRWPFAWS